MDGTLEERVAALEQEVTRFREGHRRVSDSVRELKASVDVNTQITQEIHDVIESFKGFARVVGWVGRGFVFTGKYMILPAATVGALIYALFHGGKFPAWWKDMISFLWE